MSKEETTIEKKQNNLQLNMSTRQQINFLLNKTSSQVDWTVDNLATIETFEAIEYELWWEQNKEDSVIYLLIFSSKAFLKRKKKKGKNS